MILGTVNVDCEAVITLKVQGLHGQEQGIEAIIDTGFSRSLTLPPALIAVLRLPWLTQGRALLANGKPVTSPGGASTEVQALKAIRR